MGAGGVKMARLRRRDSLHLHPTTSLQGVVLKEGHVLTKNGVHNRVTIGLKTALLTVPRSVIGRCSIRALSETSGYPEFGITGVLDFLHRPEF
jgi:hypothetical protein